jgi:hypothetical protein
MNEVQRVVITILLILVNSSTVTCQSPMDFIADSHIRANVPDEKDFDNFLRRDLAAHFKELKKKEVVVEYELLRGGPTQSGTAFPKFYAWVRVKENGNLLEEGAVRIAAIEKKRCSDRLSPECRHSE